MAIWLEPVRGGHPDASFGSLSGYELLREQLSGERFPKPPLAHLTGLRIVEVERGSVVFELPLTGWLRSPQGAISIGPMTIPADAALALAILSTLGPGVRLTTSELSLRVLAPARPEGRLIARASLMHTRRTIGLSEVTVTDEHGRLLAHGTSLCFIVDNAGAAARSEVPEPPRAAPRPDTYASPDPWQREPLGEVIDQATWDRLSGLEVAQGMIAGELPQPPIHHLIGLETRAVTDGAATFALPATRWLCAPPPGRLQGGTVALLAESALSTAIQTTLPPATALAPIDLKVNFLRPALADGRDLIAHGRVAHRGRRLAVANAEVLDADNRRVALATGSAMILPGRPATL
jgi:uncharacterized protein (TIGR00369 family)